MSVHYRFLAAALLVVALSSGCGADTTDPGAPGNGPSQEPDPVQSDPGPGPGPGPVDPEPGPVPVPGPRDPSNSRIDSDCDGLTDAEEWGNLYPGSLRTDPSLRDSDGDGIRDGVEVGRTTTINTSPTCRFMGDADPASRTHPANPDTDGDGLRDGAEDANRNGRLDPGETDAANRDTDGDGLTDGAEDANKDGAVDATETDPRLRDTDGDGLSDSVEQNVTRTSPRNADTDGDSCRDGVEDRNGNGVKDTGETDPKNGADCGAGSQPDTDADGVPDAVEDPNRNGTVDPGETNARNPDTDSDGLRDGLEDRNRNGLVDSGETNPRVRDSDCDGLLDGPEQGTWKGEDVNANGQKDPGETDPSNRDTDADGLVDGVERGVPASAAPVTTCGYTGDVDNATTTDPLDNDSDDDGIADGAEDSNQNGKKDPSELDPRNGADGAGNTPAGQACAARNLRTVTFKEDGGADMRLALRPSFREVKQLLLSGTSRGFIGYDDESKVTFLAYKRGRVGTSSTATGDETGIRAQLNGVAVETTQTFTTWDGFPAVQAYYNTGAVPNLRDYTNSLANVLVGSGAGGLTGGGSVTGPFKLQAQYVHRSDASVLVVLAITPKAAYNEAAGVAKAARFTTADTAGGTALAQFGDADAVQCETFTAGSGAADFLFVVDDSRSMEGYQNALGNAATAMATRLGNSSLDWRIAMVTTSYTQSWTNNGNLFRGFTRDLMQFKAWLQQNAPCPNPDQGCWVNIMGSSEERTLEAARTAVDYMASTSTPSDKRLRPGAKLVVIALTDVRDQPDTTPVSTFIDYFKTGNPAKQVIQLHGIICDPTGGRCHPEEDNTNPRHLEVIQATGGIVGSIRSDQSIQDTMYAIVDSVIASTGYRTLKPPIGASVRVSLQGVQDPARCAAADLPRSQTNGFDVDGVSQTLSFYGACRPAAAGTTQAAISYRYWVDRTTNRDGNPPPCSVDTGYYDANDPDFCKGKLTCNRQTNRCECPSDCGGGGAAGQVCNTSKDVCAFGCASDCGGTCGSFQACNTTTCSCQCVASATCAPGFKFDPNACGCVCDTAALNCGAAYQADANACACVCKTNCGGACPSNTVCNMNTCGCEPKMQ